MKKSFLYQPTHSWHSGNVACTHHECGAHNPVDINAIIVLRYRGIFRQHTGTLVCCWRFNGELAFDDLLSHLAMLCRAGVAGTASIARSNCTCCLGRDFSVPVGNNLRCTVHHAAIRTVGGGGRGVVFFGWVLGF